MDSVIYLCLQKVPKEHGGLEKGISSLLLPERANLSCSNVVTERVGEGQQHFSHLEWPLIRPLQRAKREGEGAGLATTAAL